MWLDTIVSEGAHFDSLPDRVTELEALADRVGDRYLTTLAHYIRWAQATQSGRMGAALETARRLRAHGEQSSYPPAVCWGACLEADGHAKAGNAAEAELAVRAGRQAAACGFDLLMAELALGMTLVTAGRTEDGLALLKKAPWRTDRIGALYFAYAGDVAFGRALAAAGEVKEGIGWLRDGIEWFERIGNRRAACMAALELARILIENANHNGSREGFRLRLRTLFAGAASPVDEARICLDRVLAAKQTLSMHDACAEALMLQARLAERDKDLAAARAALAEAHAIAASLEWLPLEQRINTEIRRLGVQRVQ
jgi:hypothetical protein